MSRLTTGPAGARPAPRRESPVPPTQCPARPPGEHLVAALRARVRRLALGKSPPTTDPTVRITDVLHLWSAFDRSWLGRLLPPAAPPADAGEAEPPEKSGLPDLDPRTADGRRLRDVWVDVAEELLRRGQGLSGADALPGGVEELMGEAYLVAARRWPGFVYEDREHTVRWLVCILHRLLQRAVHRSHTDPAVPLPDDTPDGPEPPDPTATQATLSRAEERELMAARVLALHARFPAECRADDMPDRVVGRSTLQLFVAAETLETALRLAPEDGRLWGLLSVRRASSDEAARRFGASVGALNVRFHRLRSSAIGLLAECWAAPAGGQQCPT